MQRAYTPTYGAHSIDEHPCCCLFNRQSKCYQTQKQYCSGVDTEWLKIPDNLYNSSTASVPTDRIETPDSVEIRPTDESGIRVSRVKLGPVCGLDPEFCLSPRSSPLMPWSTNDVTKWPVCEHSRKLSLNEAEARHMTCEVTARPCCLGIRGGCILTTKEHCDFVHGTYNEKAALCSQVNCLENTCGMLPFGNGLYPDQFYRVLTALFVHEGILQLGVTVFIQLTFVRSLEKFIGWARVMFVYLLSGSVGNFLAAYFQPYQIGTGPMACFVALISLRLVIQLFYTQPVIGLRLGLCKSAFILLGFFICGFLPWFDNFAHLGGLISGVLSSFVLLPYPRLCAPILPELDCGAKTSRHSPTTPISATFSHSSSSAHSTITTTPLRPHRVPIELICFALWLVFAFGLIFLFYLGGVFRCEWCSYFTCVPIAKHLCDSFRPYVDAPDVCSTQTW
ncbi:unnamed protein product [Echinostoma caproni]|uniref:Rhomboid domain-containing protein n=1 Tax=Echinostoma caproni TaxID=27848 RepID=A0A183AM76_9TREM|nr:unnamed protein product [Echinostoma caproni]